MNFFKKVYWSFFAFLLGAPFVAWAGLFDGRIIPECDVDCKWEDFVEFANNLLKLMIDLAVVIAGFSVFYAAYKYISARGSSEKIKEGHNALQHAIIGLLLVLGAWLLMDIFLRTITGKGVNEWSNPANF